jgi:hypothetical protein
VFLIVGNAFYCSIFITCCLSRKQAGETVCKFRCDVFGIEIKFREIVLNKENTVITGILRLFVCPGGAKDCRGF